MIRARRVDLSGAPRNDNGTAEVIDLDVWALHRLRASCAEANDAAEVTFRLCERLMRGEQLAL